MAKLQTVFIVETFFLSTTSKNVEVQIYSHQSNTDQCKTKINGRFELADLCLKKSFFFR